MKKAVAMLLCLVLALSLVSCGKKEGKAVEDSKSSDCTAFNSEGVKIGIDNITYVCTGMQVPIEPDESAIEYVEIPVKGNSDITAFARIHEDNEDYLVCLIGEEWYKFIAK